MIGVLNVYIYGFIKYDSIQHSWVVRNDFEIIFDIKLDKHIRNYFNFYLLRPIFFVIKL